MGKRYKKGNVGRRRNKKGKVYINREKKINRLIYKFWEYVFIREYNVSNYSEANRLRLDIKQLFDIQSTYVHSQSRKRRNIYYEQLSKFKSIYVTWKKNTLPIYLSVRFDFPEHLIPELACLYRSVQTYNETVIILGGGAVYCLGLFKD
ncbi:MAG: hypothetical protein IJH63_10370 [Methanobrevibacter sp.]|nr:hypothetical protein [Methanosphaera sp.]MBR0371104.1 hypothetical protein [Methanobrevibacter sp.]